MNRLMARVIGRYAAAALSIACAFISLAAETPIDRIISTIAGVGTAGDSGDGGPATLAEISRAGGVAVDHLGNLYIADSGNNRIRKVSVSGTITTVAGTGAADYNGDERAAVSADIYWPADVTLDSAGNLYFVDLGNVRIRKVSTSGFISTVVGNGTYGFSEDGTPAGSAELGHPLAVALDSWGNLFFSEQDNHRVRKVDASGIIITIAGDGTAGYNGDGIPGGSAKICNPSGMAVDSTGNLYFADRTNNRVREVSTSGIITTVAGGGTDGLGDGGLATSAELSSPTDVAIDSSGNLYIVDANNNRIRRVDRSGTITTVAGDGTFGYDGDGGAATSAKLATPAAISVDSKGNLYIIDSNNYRVRKVNR